jgi:hypothetical protein
LNHAYVLGYHGCDREFGERVIRKEAPFTPGIEEYHWLGAGVYFWEEDPLRALEWAQSKQARQACDDPFVVGAVIDLGRCLDFHHRDHLQLLRDTYKAFVRERQELSLKLPTNRPAKNDQRDVKVLRYLDHAVIETLHRVYEKAGLPPFDTVRGTFSEGDGVFPGSGILELTHSQIAVRNVDCIKGVFAA